MEPELQRELKGTQPVDRASNSVAHARRWGSEARFFDSVADRADLRLAAPDPLVIERYRENRRPWFNKELRFKLLGDLRGKRVLDVGCGDGDNSVLLAMYGARVTGVDISPRSIEVCHRRAELAGAGAATQFICAPLEEAELPSQSFDVLWGDGVLHHLLPVLDTVLERLVHWGRPGALFLFLEPVNLSPALRWLRLKLPIHTGATPDERPLERHEVERIRSFIPDLRVHPFDFLQRLDRFVLNDTFERSPWHRRAATDLLARADSAILSLPPLGRLGGRLVMCGTVPAPRGPDTGLWKRPEPHHAQ